jgi:hypothetical protein
MIKKTRYYLVTDTGAYATANASSGTNTPALTPTINLAYCFQTIIQADSMRAPFENALGVTLRVAKCVSAYQPGAIFPASNEITIL